MLKNKALSIFAIAAVAGLAACNRADDRTVVQDTMVTTVPAVDTIGVQRTIDIEHDTVIDTRP